MTTRLRTLVSVALLLGSAACTSAWSASAIYQNTGESDSIELSNLDGDDATQAVVTSEVAAPAVESVARGANEAGTAAVASIANATQAQQRPKQVAQTAADAPTPQDSTPISKQQHYLDRLTQQVSANGGPGSNPNSTRKYLKVDRATYLSGLNN